MKLYYHAHTDGILEGWVEKSRKKHCNSASVNCTRFDTEVEAYTFLIKRAQGDVKMLKGKIASWNSERGWIKRREKLKASSEP